MFEISLNPQSLDLVLDLRSSLFFFFLFLRLRLVFVTCRLFCVTQYIYIYMYINRTVPTMPTCPWLWETACILEFSSGTCSCITVSPACPFAVHVDYKMQQSATATTGLVPPRTPLDAMMRGATRAR